MASSNAARLALAVMNRRHKLALSQMEVWGNGGPSNTLLTTIENGRLEKLTNATAKKLDKALEWEPGTSRQIWEGDAASEAGVWAFDANYRLVDLRVDFQSGGGIAEMARTLADLLQSSPDIAEKIETIRIAPDATSEDLDAEIAIEQVKLRERPTEWASQAARTGRSKGRAHRAEMDAAGEEDQRTE